MVKETPLVKQYQKIKSQYPDTFLFFRLGDFYELFGDDAIHASKIMEVTLTKRQEMPLCGVPYHSATKYIKKLLNKSKSVAICEQTEDPSEAKGIVKREVVRVITPGTIIEDELLSEDSNNFLVSISKTFSKFGIVFLDISTGDFMGCEVDDINSLEAELSRQRVREAVIPVDSDELDSFLTKQFAEVTVTKKDSWYFNVSKAGDSIKSYFNLSTLKGWELDKYPSVTAACGGLIQYLSETQKDRKVTLKKFRIYTVDEKMILDRKTQENLELVKNLHDGKKKNTLFEALDFTDTAMGMRKLVQWILGPLKDIDKIRMRLNSVEELIQKPEISLTISELLNKTSDMERIIGKANFGSCNARDMTGLKESLKIIPALKELLKSFNSGLIKSMEDKLAPLNNIVDELEKAIKEPPPLTVKEGNIIKRGYSARLDELMDITSGDKKWVLELEERERRRLNIPKLKVGYNKVHGYYIEITRLHSNKVPPEYRRKQTLINSERYITEELKNRENSILGAEEKKIALEYKIFCGLRDMVSGYNRMIQQNSEIIAQIDVLSSFARVSKKYSYSKPHVGNFNEITIKEGRHPVVEKNMAVHEFIPNDTLLDKDENQILVITGPNMSGKSTYLKQTALITIMAQMGCFVPASLAHIGITDRIFTRIGASENLAGGESTFMVEMTEVASILNNATDKSLLVLDEVGRGTSTFDGISIAWAVIEEIARIKGRTLFATHYFELTELAGYMKNVKNYNFVVREWEDKKKVVFLRKLQPGSADKSYGIHCAQLAGVPKNVIQRAWDIFKTLQEEQFDDQGLPKAAHNAQESQLSFSGELKKDDEYREKIKNIDLNRITPIEILNEMKKWQLEIEND